MPVNRPGGPHCMLRYFRIAIMELCVNPGFNYCIYLIIITHTLDVEFPIIAHHAIIR